MIERRIKAARFPATKSLPSQACCACPAGQRISFNFKVIPSLNKVLTMQLARGEFIDRRANIIALGPGGTGKTHIALGLGLAACQKGRKYASPLPLLSSMNSSRPSTNAACSACRNNWSARTC